MKNVVKISLISFSICLLSVIVYAQTKTKPKTAVKPAETKAANAKSTSSKPADKKTAAAKPKNSAAEKNAAEKSKSAKNAPTKNQNEKTKTEKAKTEKTPAKPQTAKNQAIKKDSVKTQTAKNQTAKNQPVKVDATKKQIVKSSPATAKILIAPIVKTPTKSGIKNSVKDAPRLTSKPAANNISAINSTNKLLKPSAEFVPPPIAAANVDAGEIRGKTYSNNTFNFSFALPDDWEIADDYFAQRLKGEGFSLNVETPKAKTATAQRNLNAATNRVQILLTAFKASQETNKNAILRVSVEDLRAVPQIKDAVDYFDSMRATYQNIKLPANFKYSETQAERLGAMQFGFLDIASGAGKKRMYATVRNGFAVMFTLTYNSDEDLAALKNILAAGDFRR